MSSGAYLGASVRECVVCVCVCVCVTSFSLILSTCHHICIPLYTAYCNLHTHTHFDDMCIAVKSMVSSIIHEYTFGRDTHIISIVFSTYQTRVGVQAGQAMQCGEWGFLLRLSLAQVFQRSLHRYLMETIHLQLG